MRALLLSGVLAGVVRLATAAEIQTDLQYGEAADEPLLLDVCLPEGDGPFPAAILVHGGGWTSGDKSGGPTGTYMAPLYGALTEAGIAWFSINYRLAPEHQFPAAVEDVETAIRWVKTHASEYKIDAEQLALAGESAGAHLVMAAAVRATPATQVDAIVAIYGRYDFVTDAQETQTLRPVIAALMGVEKYSEDILPRLREASPLFHVHRDLPPVLLVHGDADGLVPYEQSIRMQARLEEAGVPNDFLTIPGGDHGMLDWDQLVPDFRRQISGWMLEQLVGF